MVENVLKQNSRTELDVPYAVRYVQEVATT
jgi:hypothetical protein